MTVIPLKFASADALSKQITDIMEKTASLAPAARRAGSSIQTRRIVKIKPDTRTNALIVIANAHDTQTIKDIVHKLDIDRPRGADNMHFVYLKNAQAETAAESLQNALAGMRQTNSDQISAPVRITADTSTNALIINSSLQNYQLIADIIEKLDVAREQVLVELKIMEISEDSLQEIGIDWQTLDDAVADSVRAFGNTNFGIRVDNASGNLEGLTVGAWKDIGGDVRIGAILSALEKKSGVNILSTPSIVTSNHQQAKIIIAENIPFVTATRITESDPSTPTAIKTIEYKDVGITLKITPHISQLHLVRLEIDSEYTKLIEGVTGLSEETPTTAKRSAQTVVSVNSGTTFVIGGLIRDDKVTLEKKIPLLGDIPLIGSLFKFQRDRIQKTNLLIFITPHVLTETNDYANNN